MKYIPQEFTVESKVNPDRVFEINNHEISDGSIIYLTEKTLRVEDNFALNFAVEKAEELNKNLKIIHFKAIAEIKSKQEFLDRQLTNLEKNYKENNLDFEIKNVSASEKIEILKELNPSILIIDFNPINDEHIEEIINCKIYEVDSQNICPARVISNKQEYNAHSFRSKIYSNIGGCLTEFPPKKILYNEAYDVLSDFLEIKLENYADYRNTPDLEVTSGLSRYLNLGFISEQRIAIEAIKSNAEDKNKTDFLEELIVRKELSDNFCLYNENYKSFDSAPSWAKFSLMQHLQDFRQNLYSKEELETANTYDALWNLTQNELINTGRIHSYLRMYWAKKLLEWTKTPQEAIDIAIYLNDKYAFDAPSANGYVGILWSIAGLHDRPFQDRPVTGKIRRMNAERFRRKCLQN